MEENKYNILSYDSLPSTQTYLMSLNLDELPQWTVLIAKEQTNGRGQNRNVWEAENNKNLTFSILLKPIFIKIYNQFLITQILSLGIFDFLSQYLRDVSIKWPNDIYVRKNKIAGILVNNKLQGEDLSFSICGIGLNVNQIFFANAPNPSSMKLELGRYFDIELLFFELLGCIYNRYDDLRQNKVLDYKKEYMSKLLYNGLWAKYEYDGELIDAKIIDVNQYGHLILINKDENKFSADLKQIKFCL